MKKKCQLASLFVFLLLAAVSAGAQQASAPARQQEKCQGFWVIENNIRTPLENTVHFYNGDKIEVYREIVEGIKIDLSKRRVRTRLNKSLKAAITAFNEQGPTFRNGNIVASCFRKSWARR